MRQKTWHAVWPLLLLAAICCAPAAAADQRNIVTGRQIPDQGYCDQPYIVVTQRGDWLCTLTTGAGQEGARGQHVVSTISADQGRTWSPLTDIEPASGPAASWVVPLLTPSGRLYAFYTYNGDHVHLGRDDVHGWYVMKYSDDDGRTWSQDRYRLPLRLTACDRLQKDGRTIQMFWGIDKPSIAADGTVYFAFTKLGKYLLKEGEGWLFASDNLITARDPRAIHWALRPTGEHGIRNASFGSIQEEHNLVPLGSTRLFCVYRTALGFPCQAYSNDGGRTWTEPEPMVYRPGGRVVRQPRACPKLWRCGNGKFLFWYHLNGGHGYQGRNPAWIIGGILKAGRLHWSEPEILLYAEDPQVRMSYPDLIEQEGHYWVTETQKTIARVHSIDPTLIDGLWAQVENRLPRVAVARGCIAQFNAASLQSGRLDVRGPITLKDGKGFTVDLWATFDRFTPGQTLLDTRDQDGSGWAVTVGENRTLVLSIRDGRHRSDWDSDPELLSEGKRHHIAFVIDGGPNVICVIVDGRVCDGGGSRPFGWGRFDPEIGDVAGTRTLAVDLAGVRVDSLRIYNRSLRTAEVIQNDCIERR